MKNLFLCFLGVLLCAGCLIPVSASAYRYHGHYYRYHYHGHYYPYRYSGHYYGHRVWVGPAYGRPAYYRYW
jgi:hypothetical protein